MYKGTKPEERIIRWVAISLAVFAMLSYYLNIFCRFDALIISTQDAIVGGIANSPNKYRLLVPFLNDGISWLSFIILGNPAKGMVFTFTISIFIALNYFFMVKLSRHLFTNYISILLTLFCFTIFMVAGMNHHSYQPWSYLESGLYLAGVYWFLSKKHPIGFFIISILAVFTRETGVFLTLIPLAHLITNKNKSWIVYLLNVIVCISLLVGIRYGLGTSNEVIRLPEIFLTNLETLHLILLPLLLVSGLLVLPLLSNKKNFPLKNVHLIFLIYLIPVILFGRWLEIRMLLPFAFYLIPLMVYIIMQPFHSKESGN